MQPSRSSASNVAVKIGRALLRVWEIGRNQGNPTNRKENLSVMIPNAFVNSPYFNQENLLYGLKFGNFNGINLVVEVAYLKCSYKEYVFS